jgi:hypothetical protein
VTPPLSNLVLYGRPGCHLCEDTRVVVQALLAERAARGLWVPVVVERSIEDDEGLHRRFALTIPVLGFADRELELATSPATVRRFLAEALDAEVVRDGQGPPVTSEVRL